MTLHGRLYEITNFDSFVRCYLMQSNRPDPDSVRPLKDAQITLCPGEGTGSGSPPPIQCRTDDAGRFELDVSRSTDAPMFVVASRLGRAAEGSDSEKLRQNYWYRSACFRPVALDQRAREIYLARATIPDESGFSQTDLAGVLDQTKKQVADLERITGQITGDGIALSGSGKGATASGKILLEPDRSGDLATIMRHVLTDFRLDLPGPAWLIGLLVSREAIEESIRASVHDLAGQINDRLRAGAVQAFTDQVTDADKAFTTRLAREATLTLERVRYPVVSNKAGTSGALRAIAGDVLLGFPRVLYKTGRSTRNATTGSPARSSRSRST